MTCSLYIASECQSWELTSEDQTRVHIWYVLPEAKICVFLLAFLDLRKNFCRYSHILSQALLAEIIMLERVGEKRGSRRLIESGCITQRAFTFY